MNKYLQAIAYNLAFFVINTLFFLVITPLALRGMGEEIYGLWAILSAIQLFSGVGTLRMGVVVNKFASEGGENALEKPQVISTGFSILLPLALVIAVILI